MLNLLLADFFERDLLKLKEEINLYKEENNLWKIENKISNSAGNLCLHLIGNLNHFIGATLGNTGYVRQRELEFSSKNIPRNELHSEIDKLIPIVVNTLKNLNDADFEANFPLEKHGKIVKTDYMLFHLLTHLNYHIGQINYHRRLLE
ncbi:MAG TPA: DUF1572 family protein [Chitinophagales bacterium]|nr:DUF1572 family protein [Chitinophagales bacterium]